MFQERSRGTIGNCVRETFPVPEFKDPAGKTILRYRTYEWYNMAGGTVVQVSVVLPPPSHILHVCCVIILSSISMNDHTFTLD